MGWCLLAPEFCVGNHILLWRTRLGCSRGRLDESAGLPPTTLPLRANRWGFFSSKDKTPIHSERAEGEFSSACGTKGRLDPFAP